MIKTIFDKETGEIRGYAQGTNVQVDNFGSVDGQYSACDYYVDVSYPDNPMPTKKGMIMPEILPGTTVSVGETVSINGIPPGVTLTVEGQSHVVTDGTFEIDFTDAETYPITMTGVPYYDWSGSITVKAAS